MLTVGTLCNIKGQLTQLAALATLPSAQLESLQLLWVGSAAEPGGRRTLRALAGLPSNLKSRVTHLPETADVARYYAAADVYLCSSFEDTYPRSLMEALACGLPIVSTTVDGCPELLGPDTAAVFEAGNAIQLSSILGRLISDDSERSRLASRSRARFAEHTTYDEMIASYVRPSTLSPLKYAAARPSLSRWSAHRVFPHVRTETLSTPPRSSR
ncbi:MAG: glycosyltransferase [Gammaproteobacteria bacterium]|nr:glycosyltransferase [Gammaproteobacteria bacterium]